MEAPPGKHDDALVSLMIANAVCHYSPGARAPYRNREKATLQQAVDSSQWDEDMWEIYESKNRGGMANLLNALIR